ncbi:AraC-like DNA-binding protein [Rhizobium leguminosarum]|uniref:AraC-like DNA-binding protein n=1 Tax=Rhizobium leguminosarum TaxID=384 RepID=A0AAE2SZW4_RHILE|nr:MULTISPECIES: AraC family transcriptional regulator [Rhizobium]ARM90984.1 AraC family transcriptional regulator protein [Rhizobium sp. CIAT894]MBB4293845.1 AraC-like DNA-binding protein [Rhizobium leguminosarum]MBB4299578.1 AraC-like DNA-binding protein [Rhizobium leguminosarum]MBB4311015.1 AraC-like DNA-binding protein [Rhizobium leguminosarum]MBB4420136.1 AraC-like DNA-binding protein [Rhizobium leguminosarum]
MDNKARQMIAARTGIGATGHVTQATRLGFTSITTALPMIVVVHRGRKVIQCPGHRFVVDPGEAIAIAQGHIFDFENAPSEDGDYEARWLTVDSKLIATFGVVKGSDPVAPARLLGRMSKGLSDAFEAAITALGNEDELPDAIVEHRVTELLAWMRSSGLCFPLAQAQSYAARIRTLVAERPDHGWSGAEICSLLGLSEATLRRRLHDESIKLRELVTDVRMIHAMSLLQSSRLPISSIAASSGFASQSKFAIRFRTRFGFPPTAIRGHNRGPAASGSHHARLSPAEKERVGQSPAHSEQETRNVNRCTFPSTRYEHEDHYPRHKAGRHFLP